MGSNQRRLWSFLTAAFLCRRKPPSLCKKILKWDFEKRLSVETISCLKESSLRMFFWIISPSHIVSLVSLYVILICVIVLLFCFRAIMEHKELLKVQWDWQIGKIQTHHPFLKWGQPQETRALQEARLIKKTRVFLCLCGWGVAERPDCHFCPALCTHTAHVSFPCCVRYFFYQQWAQESCHMVQVFLGKWARLKEDTVGVVSSEMLRKTVRS